MRVALIGLALAPFLSACAGSSCRSYIEAVNQCNDAYLAAFDAAEVDLYQSDVDDALCDVYDNPLYGPLYGPLTGGIDAVYSCQAAAYSSQDCSTEEGYRAAASAASACN